ncbi:MAG: hypothetical protein ACK4K7_03520 [Allosphingosinicella sp.]|uniref:hypothetical protein n=1 Tax=Allosphingosinicella sp. TaxID=2823234 RepID=UPI00395EF584
MPSFRTALAGVLMMGAMLAAPAHAQTAEERAQLDRVLERGRLLFALDRAAWVGTDDMVERIADPRGAGIRGYLALPGRDGFEVIFHGGSDQRRVQVYRGVVAASGVVKREVFPADARPPLAPVHRRMAEAVEAAARAGHRPCGNRPFNPLVIPPRGESDPIEVYLMTPQVDARLPAGGHFRVTVAPDGTVASSRPFTNSCLLLEDPAGAVGLIVSHLLDPVPTEIHVFTAMAAGVPLYVATRDPARSWEVSGNSIRLVEAPAERP